MSNTGNVFPGTGSTVDRAGATAWTTPGNITADDTTNATSTVPTDYLLASNFNFSSIPNNVAIRGVVVRVEMSETGSGSSNYVVQLMTAATPTLVGNASGTITVTTGPTISTTGSATDLWGTTLTAAQVKNSGFGVALWSTDTINGLQCDFITIAIEWTDIPQAWMPLRMAQPPRRRSLKRRHLREIPALSDVPSTPAPPVESPDRTITAGFVTRILPPRRPRSIEWIAALAAPPASAPVVPASAWMTAPRARVRKTTRRLIVVDVTVIERYTPPSIAWSDPAPRVLKRIVYKRKIVPQAPQLTFPPTTGPPLTAQSFPAWQVPPAKLMRSAARRELRPAAAPVYPQTPSVTTPIAAVTARRPFRRKAEKGLLLWSDWAPSGEAAAGPPSDSDDRSIADPFVTRTQRSRRHLVARVAPVFPAPPAVQQPLSAWIAPKKFTIVCRTKLRRTAAQVTFPATPAVSAQPVSAWRQPPLTRRQGEHKLLVPPVHAVFPATPAPPVVPSPAVTLHRLRRRKRRQGLFLSAGTALEARVQPQFPSWRVEPIKQRRTKRHLLRSPIVPEFPQPPPPQPVAAWRALIPFRIEHERTLRRGAPQITFPTTAPVPPQPVSAWTPRPAFIVEQRRKLLPAAPQITYPPTPPHPPVPRIDALRKRITTRTLLRALHLPSYPGTPAPPQPPTAYQWPPLFRRSGWRKHLVVLELDQRPRTPDTPGYLTAVVSVFAAIEGEVSVVPAIIGAPSARPIE